MKYEKNRTFLGLDEYTLMRFLRFLILPGVVLVLVLVILLFDAPRRKAKKESEAAAASAAEVAAQVTEAVETEPVWVTTDYSTAVPEPNTVPEIDQLVQDYLDAKKTGDAEKLYQVFGRTDREGFEELAQKMHEESKIFEDFTGTQNMVIPGVDRDSYIVYIRTDGWFRKVTSPAPLLMRAYVMRKAEGNYIMKEDSALTDAERDAVRLADGAPAVAAMNNEQRSALAKAIVNDGKLGSLYEAMRPHAESGQSGAAAESGNGAAAGQAGGAGEGGANGAVVQVEAESSSGEAETTVEITEAVVEIGTVAAETESAAAETAGAAEETAAAADGAGAAAETESAAAETAAETAGAAETAAETAETAAETAAETTAGTAETETRE